MTAFEQLDTAKLDIFEYDRAEGIDLLCGVDEAGRGPLAGDVYAAAVILPPDCRIEGLNDSKKLTAKKRLALFFEIKEKALSYSVGVATVAEIEEQNILNATFLAMRRAVDGLSVKPRLVLVDGNQNPHLSNNIHSRLLIKGDATSACIAAASILAKVSRDIYMDEIAKEYPQYFFEKHKGYGTALHYKALAEHGLSPVHRPSFLKNLDEHVTKAKAEELHKKAAGRLGEDFCSEYLEKNGWRIVIRNFTCLFGEIDIIAQKDDIVAFVEVKARKSGSLMLPREAVTASKQSKIKRSASCWFENNVCDLQPRFDIAEVYLTGKDRLFVEQFEYIENAF